MNQFLVASALVGSTLGFFHGRTLRQSQRQQPPLSILQEASYSARDIVIGAAAFPFVVPIGVYQIATKAGGNTCIFQSMFSPTPPSKKSLSSSETPLQ